MNYKFHGLCKCLDEVSHDLRKFSDGMCDEDLTRLLDAEQKKLNAIFKQMRRELGLAEFEPSRKA